MVMATRGETGARENSHCLCAIYIKGEEVHPPCFAYVGEVRRERRNEVKGMKEQTDEKVREDPQLRVTAGPA